MRGCFVHKLFIWDLDSWPLYRGGLYSGVAVKRGSTVIYSLSVPLHIFSRIYAGVKVDLSGVTDSIEAISLSYKNNYIQVYSNSWGPSDLGFIVSKPGTLLENAFKNAVTRVII